MIKKGIEMKMQWYESQEFNKLKGYLRTLDTSGLSIFRMDENSRPIGVPESAIIHIDNKLYIKFFLVGYRESKSVSEEAHNEKYKLKIGIKSIYFSS